MSGPVVCHVTSVHVPTDSRVLYHECRSSAKRYRTLLVCRDDGTPRTIEGVEIIPLSKPANRMARFAGIAQTVRIAENLKADLYHFHDPELLSAMAALAKRTGVPVIYDAHEDYPAAMDQKAWIPRPLRPLAARSADRAERRHVPAMAAVAVADAGLQRRFSAMHDRVVQLDNYPPLDLFPISPRVMSGPPTLAYVGSVSAVRGFYEMLDVLRAIRRTMPDARLLVFGRPTEEVVAGLGSLVDLPAGAVEMRGPVPYGELGTVLREVTVGLSLLRPHPKYESNISMKVFDYMAAGVPYVASDFTPLRAATGGIGGQLVPPGNTEAATAAVLELLGDPAAAIETGLQGRSLVETALNWAESEKRLLDLYRDLLTT